MDAKICYVMRNWRTKNIKTAPKTYKNNNIRKTKNQEISSSRFLFPPTPLKKNITNRVWQNWKTIHLKKSLPVLLIFILEIKRTHILKYFFFVKSYFDFIFWNNLVPLCKQVKKIYNFFLPSYYPLRKNISFFFRPISLKTKWKLETNFGFIMKTFSCVFYILQKNLFLSSFLKLDFKNKKIYKKNNRSKSHYS